MTAMEMLNQNQTTQPQPSANDPVIISARQAAALGTNYEQACRGNLDVLAKGILVMFSCPMPGNRKTDKQVTSEVKRDKHMGDEAGDWRKCIFPPKEYAILMKAHNAARSYHYEQTLGWPITGLQLLPTGNHAKYCEGMREQKALCHAADQAFLAKLPEFEDWARIQHNGSFDASLYIHSKVAAKFDWKIDFQPIPASDHYATSIKSILGIDADNTDQLVATAIKDAQAELWQRLITPLENMIAILGKKDSGEQTRVTESLLENICGIADQIPALNLGDAALDQFAKDAQSAFCGVTKKELSENSQARSEAIKAANALLAKMAGFAPIQRG